MQVKKILFIHPSRGRPQMAMDSMNGIVSKMNTQTPWNYVVSVDMGDLEAPKYLQDIPPRARVICNSNPHEVVDATNRAAELLDDEDVIIANTDDYRWADGWDEPLLALLETLPDMALVSCPDYNSTIAVPQILTAALYRRLGYVFWPEYVSMYADNDLLEAARKLGCAYELRPLILEHVHPHFGKRPMDATTARTNEQSKTQLGQAVLAQRRARGFDL